MATEIPKAYRAAEVDKANPIPTEESLRQAGSARAELLSKLATDVDTFESEERAKKEWDLANPPPELSISGLPEKPVYDCVLEKSKEYVQCAKDFSEASVRFNSPEVQNKVRAFYDSDEYKRHQDEVMQHKNRRKRETKKSVSDQTFDQIAKLAGEVGLMPDCRNCSRVEIGRDLLAKLIAGNDQWTEDQVASSYRAQAALEKAVERIASDTCNRNGIYE
jgi:hypothetical protein